MATDSYDAALLGILQNEGQIAKFLDTVMGFLYRRTDFYHVMKSREERLGFPPGVAPRLLIQAYEKYETLAKERDLSKDNRKLIPSRPELAEPVQSVAPPHQRRDSANKSAEKSTESESKVATTNQASDVESSPLSSETSSQKVFQANPESHNGAMRDGFRWAQTLTDCDLRVNVPAHVVKGKQVDVSIKRKHITVRHVDPEGRWTVAVDSDLSWDINAEETIWSLVPKDCVHINMEKVQERWWENVFVDEPRISTREIEASVPMDHLDEGAQATVDKLMYDENQKRLGLPTSDQQKVQETLRKAWDAEGSPFRGTPYDPSVVDVRNSNMP